MQMNSNDVEIKVTASQLIEEANELSDYIEKVRNLMDEFSSLVDLTESYWMGDAHAAFLEMYSQNLGDAMNMLQMLEENPKDLIAIATNYTITEMKQVMTSVALPSDVIF